MGVSLQTHRLRIGTYNQKFSTGNLKNPDNETFKENFKVHLFLLIIMNMMMFLVILQSPWLPTLFLPSPSETYSSTWSSSGTPPCTISSRPPLTILSLSCLQNLYGRISKSSNPCWQTQSRPPAPPWTTPPWPADPPLALNFVSHVKLRHQHLRCPASWLTARMRNSIMKAINGNRPSRGRGIKIIAWNKGSSYLQNKHHEIETIIAADKPHIIGLSEANLKKDTDLSLVQHDDYTLHTAPTLENPLLGISRLVVYTHSSLVVKRRHDLENDSLSAVWLELGMPRQKKIIVGNIYREWQHMGQGPDSLSGSVAAQLQRWLIFIDMWEKVLREGKEVMVLGDINLDFLKWTRDNLPASDSSFKLKQLNEQLFSRIFPLGVSQLVTTATRVSPVAPPSGLDHVYTNRPDRCSEVRAELNGGSDHKVLKITRFSKANMRTARYVKKRCYKEFLPHQVLRGCQANILV